MRMWPNRPPESTRREDSTGATRRWRSALARPPLPRGQGRRSRGPPVPSSPSRLAAPHWKRRLMKQPLHQRLGADSSLPCDGKTRNFAAARRERAAATGATPTRRPRRPATAAGLASPRVIAQRARPPAAASAASQASTPSRIAQAAPRRQAGEVIAARSAGLERKPSSTRTEGRSGARSTWKFAACR